MNRPTTIAGQADVVARELASLIELLDGGGDGGYAGPIAEAIAAVESIGRLVDCARVRVLAPTAHNCYRNTALLTRQSITYSWQFSR